MLDGEWDKTAQRSGQFNAKFECRPVVAAMGPCQFCSCPGFNPSPDSRMCVCFHAYEDHGARTA